MQAGSLVVPIPLTLAAASMVFNLVCSGTSSESHRDQRDDRVNPRVVAFRVDMTRQRWCMEDCQTLIPTAKVTDSFITFGDNVNHEKRVLTQVFRNTGAMASCVGGKLMDAPGTYRIGFSGNCKKAPFSGFPRRRF